MFQSRLIEGSEPSRLSPSVGQYRLALEHPLPSSAPHVLPAVKKNLPARSFLIRSLGTDGPALFK